VIVAQYRTLPQSIVPPVCRADTLSIACYAVQRRRVRHLAEGLHQAFTKGLVTYRWAEGGLSAMEVQLAELKASKEWLRTDTLQVYVFFGVGISILLCLYYLLFA
jgi:hypothetical protein